MLKVNEDKIDKLSEYGFKPRYDIETGEIRRYIWRTEKADNIGISIELSYEEWEVYLRNIQDETIDMLYDLIQLGIIVKE